ncbi:Uncharacterised protein [uncultured Clostridium sp.]|nr:Uncharacterised protein [uncultured Clostridium sp.]SCJ28541.1 Uncharacterised protein [uncultured Clostridium sp.]
MIYINKIFTKGKICYIKVKNYYIACELVK